jgi:beta-lactamase class A
MYEQPHGRDDPEPFGQRFHLSRREFLATLAAASGALGCGVPGLAGAASSAGTAGGTGAGLQRQVGELLRRMKDQGLIGAAERTSWAVYDITAGRTLVAINENSPRQAASMIKPFVAQAFFFQAKNAPGRVRYTAAVRDTMERSIRKSNNPATNELMDLVSNSRSRRGPQDVELVLKDNAPSMFLQTRVVERIPANGRTFRNLASAADYTRFLVALWLDRLPYSGEMKELMALPNRDRICQGVEAMPDSVRVYDKTGSTSRLCGDMGIIEARTLWGRRVPYVFVGIIERPDSAGNYASWITRRSNAIRAVSNLVYLDMKDRYRLE